MSGGVKDKAGKAQYSLLNLWALEPCVRVLMYGAAKYPQPMNWQGVVPLEYYDAALRHLAKMQNGEWTDPESDQSHLAHVVCNFIFLSWFERQGKFTYQSIIEKRPEQQDLRQSAQPQAQQQPSARSQASSLQPSKAPEIDTSGQLAAVQLRLERLLKERRHSLVSSHSAAPGSEKAAAETPAPASSISATQTTPAISYEDMGDLSPHTRKTE